MALSQGQIAQLWVQQGGDPKYANVMSRIALRESGGRPKINNRGTNSNGTTDWGLYQVNDVWRKDPVIGPMFKSGAILTPQGATKAAIRILKVQGPKAWSTYNPAVDAKYIGQMPGSPRTVRRSAAGATAQVAAPPDSSLQRAALISQYLATEHQPGALTTLAEGLTQQPSMPKPAKVATPAPSAPARAPKAQGVTKFAGTPVAAWIAPILNYARAHGWNGSITSGYRSYADQKRIYDSGIRPAAKPGTSNHEFTAFPGGAVDVTNAQQLAQILQRSPYAKTLVWAGAKDPVHFSHPSPNGSY